MFKNFKLKFCSLFQKVEEESVEESEVSGDEGKEEVAFVRLVQTTIHPQCESRPLRQCRISHQIVL